MDPVLYATLIWTGTAALFGGFGQWLRSIVGLTKLRLEEGASWKPDWAYYVLTIVMGAGIGIAAGVIFNTMAPEVIIPIGYAGSDALEGLFSKRINK